MKKQITLFILLLNCLNLFSQNTFVFLGSFNRDKAKDGIFVYQLDTIKGKLTRVTTVKNILNPSFLTVSADGKFVFACTESKTKNAGSVSSFQFDPENKTLNFINSQKSGGENPVYLTIHENGKWLINGNYTEGSISVYPVSEEGLIKPMVQNFHYEEGSINKNRQDRSHVHSTVFSPNFDYLFSADLGADLIRTYQFDDEKSEPLLSAEIPFTKTIPGSGPRHFTFHPNAKFAYCIEELTGTVDVYKYDNGKLDNLQRINTHSDKHRDNFESSDIHLSPDGKFLYASNRGGENNIAIFSVQEDGTLKNVSYQSTLGKHPRIFTIDESGEFLIATNSVSGDVVVFRRNSKTGLLRKVGKKVKIPGVSSVQIKTYNN